MLQPKITFKKFIIIYIADIGGLRVFQVWVLFPVKFYAQRTCNVLSSLWKRTIKCCGFSHSLSSKVDYSKLRGLCTPLVSFHLFLYRCESFGAFHIFNATYFLWFSPPNDSSRNGGQWIAWALIYLFSCANLSTDHHSVTRRWESNKTKCVAVKIYNCDCIHHSGLLMGLRCCSWVQTEFVGLT